MPRLGKQALEECGDTAQEIVRIGHRVDGRRNRLAERRPVVLGDETRIRDDHDPAIGLRTHQPSESLPKLDDRLGKHIVAKGTAALAIDLLAARLDDGIPDLCERQSRENHTGERLARDIHSFPKGLRAEENDGRGEGGR